MRYICVTFTLLLFIFNIPINEWRINTRLILYNCHALSEWRVLCCAKWKAMIPAVAYFFWIESSQFELPSIHTSLSRQMICGCAMVWKIHGFEQNTIATGNIQDYAIFWIILTGWLPRQQQLVETGLPCREWVRFRSNHSWKKGSRVIWYIEHKYVTRGPCFTNQIFILFLCFCVIYWYIEIASQGHWTRSQWINIQDPVPWLA